MSNPIMKNLFKRSTEEIEELLNETEERRENFRASLKIARTDVSRAKSNIRKTEKNLSVIAAELKRRAKEEKSPTQRFVKQTYEILHVRKD